MVVSNPSAFSASLWQMQCQWRGFWVKGQTWAEPSL